MSRRILVLGGSGLLGRPVVNKLLQKGQKVRILTRHAEKSRLFLPESVEAFQGSVLNREDIKKSLAGCAGVHISLPQESELVAAEHIADLGKGGSLERITYISATGVGPENRWFSVIDVKMRTEEAIRKSGIPYIFFRPTWAMESLRNFVRGDRATVISSSNPPAIHFFAAEDLGRMVSDSYKEKTCLGKSLYVHGPEAITLPEALGLFINSCHPDISVSNLKLWQARVLALAIKRLRYVTGLIAFYERVGEIGDPAEANSLYGPPLITLDNWIKNGKEHNWPELVTGSAQG